MAVDRQRLDQPPLITWRLTARMSPAGWFAKALSLEHLPDGSCIAEVIPPAKSGIVSYRLVTTNLGPERHPRRSARFSITSGGDIKGLFKQIKSVLLNPARVVRFKPPDGVRQESWAHLPVHYAITRVIVDAAHMRPWSPTASSGPETGFRTLSPLNCHCDHHRCLIREVAGVINLPRHDSAIPG